MTVRTVLDTVLNGDGTPYAEQRVTFYLRRGSSSVVSTYPPTPVNVTTDEDGAYSADLWPNTEGLTPTTWLAVYPGNATIEFTLFPGAPISMSEIRAAGLIHTWSTPDLTVAMEAYRATWDASLANEADTRESADTVQQGQITAGAGNYSSLAARMTGIDALPGAMRLAAGPSASATTVTLRTAPTTVGADLGYLIIDPFTDECEVRPISALAGTTATVSALTYAHAADDAVLWSPEPLFHTALFGARGNLTTDDSTAILRCVSAGSSRIDTAISALIGLKTTRIYFNPTPAGYKTTVPVPITAHFTHITAEPGTLVKNFTSGSNVFEVNAAGAYILYSPIIENLSIKGTGITSKGIYANATSHACYRHVNLIGHPGPGIVQESTYVGLTGCLGTHFDQPLVQPNAAVTGIYDNTGYLTKFTMPRVMQCEIGIHLYNPRMVTIENPYLEDNTKGTEQGAIKITTDGSINTRFHAEIINMYDENNPGYTVYSDRGATVAVRGGRNQGGANTSTKVAKSRIQLDGGGEVSDFHGGFGTQIRSDYGHVMVRRSPNCYGRADRVHFEGALPPFHQGAVNLATRSWFDTPVTNWSGNGASPPVMADDATVGFLGATSKKATFSTSAFGSSNYVNPATLNLSSTNFLSGEQYYGLLAFKADAAGELLVWRTFMPADGAIITTLTDTEWQIVSLLTRGDATAASLSNRFYLSVAPAGSTNIWFGAAAYAKSEHVAFINTDMPTLALGQSQVGTLFPDRLIGRIRTFTSGDATPSVAGGNVFITAGSTAITAFDDGTVGQTIKVRAAASITITNSASLKLLGGVDFVMTADDTLTLTMYATGVWTEDARSVN